MQKFGKYALQRKIQDDNQRNLLLLLLSHGPLSRTEIAERTGVSLTAISKQANQMLDEGMIVWDSSEDQQEEKTVGRPAEKLAINSRYAVIPVVRMKRGHCHFSLLDFSLKTISETSVAFVPDFVMSDRMQPTSIREQGVLPIIDAEQFAEFICNQIQSMLNSTSGITRVLDILISLPGSYNREQSLYISGPLKLSIDVAFSKSIKSRLSLDTVLLNDSDCFAYGEKIQQPDDASFIFVNYHYGLGAGVFQDGKHFKTTENRAVELGHISIDYHGPRCACGSRGCLERYIGFDSLIDQAREKRILSSTNDSIDVLAEAYRNENAHAIQIVDGAAEKLALGLSNLMAVFVSQKILLGGGIEVFGDHFLSSLSGYMKSPPVRNSVRETPVAYATDGHGQEALGCAYMFIAKIWRPRSYVSIGDCLAEYQ